MHEQRQYSTFFLEGFLFGVEVKQVQEVLRFQEMTRVPLAPPVVRGLINLRGEIVTALDLRRRLALADRPEGELPMNVVLRTEDGAVSLLVDEIGDILEVVEDDFEPPPETLTGPVRALVRGACKLDDQLLIILDADKVVNLDAASTHAA